MTKFELSAEVRTQHGKAMMRRMRRIEDKIPAVIYGAGKSAESITLLHKDILHALENEAVFSHVLKIHLNNGQTEQVVLKAIQRHVFKPKIVHVDFLRIDAKEKIHMHVPLHFLNEEACPGVKDGGLISKQMTDLEVKCLPGNLPEFIEVDLSTLELDHVVHMSDVRLPKGVELLHELDEQHDHPVVIIHLPRAAKEEDAQEIVAESTEEALLTEESAEASEENSESNKE